MPCNSMRFVGQIELRHKKVLRGNNDYNYNHPKCYDNHIIHTYRKSLVFPYRVPGQGLNHVQIRPQLRLGKGMQSWHVLFDQFMR